MQRIKESRTEPKSSKLRKTEQDFFANLPLEIVIDILSRLPIRTTVRCKCVCKQWLGVIESREFSKSHPLKTVVFFQEAMIKDQFKVFKFVDELDPARPACFCSIALNFDFPHVSRFQSIHTSVDGFIFQWICFEGCPLYICNPITHDYVEIPIPSKLELDLGGAFQLMEHSNINLWILVHF